MTWRLVDERGDFKMNSRYLNEISNRMEAIRRFKSRVIGHVDFDRIENRLTTNSQLSLGYLLMLVSSCLIALLGLLMNSSAVVIGAMLISPLMDPILGGALAIATMNRSENLKNIGRMVVSIAIVGIFVVVFMGLSPISDLTNELAARTKPNLFDLFVALFAAIAGTYILVAGQGGNTIPGVAIATALMPPLVTAFYGVSKGDWAIARGAGYLFITNFATITFAAVLIMWFVGFRPKYEEKNKHLKVMGGQFAVFFIIILLMAIPLTRTLASISKEARVNTKIQRAVNAIIRENDNKANVVRLASFTGSNETRVIKASVETSKYISESTIKQWEKEIGIRANMKVSLNLNQISIMDDEFFSALATLTPESGKSRVFKNNLNPGEAIAIVQKGFDEAKNKILKSAQSVETICSDIHFSFESGRPINVTCELHRPAAIPELWKSEISSLIEGILGAPVSFSFKAKETKWKVLSVFFGSGSDQAVSEMLSCEQIAPPSGLSASYELLGFNDGIGDAAANIRLTQRRQASVANMMKICGLKEEMIYFGPVKSILSDSKDDSRNNRRVEIWISPLGF